MGDANGIEPGPEFADRQVESQNRDIDDISEQDHRSPPPLIHGSPDRRPDGDGGNCGQPDDEPDFHFAGSEVFEETREVEKHGERHSLSHVGQPGEDERAGEESICHEGRLGVSGALQVPGCTVRSHQLLGVGCREMRKGLWNISSACTRSRKARWRPSSGSFRRSSRPGREAGFEVTGAWMIPETNQFIWIVGCKDGIDAASDRYYSSELRKAIDPEPAKLLETIDTRTMVAVPV